jgi:hypothetical protein
MELPEHAKRVVAERDELQSKIDKADSFVASDKFAELSESHRAWLSAQVSVMRHYRDILNIRIDLFKGLFKGEAALAADAE